jgi:membrane-associated protease RseP (regulator of RpoE activity)
MKTNILTQTIVALLLAVPIVHADDRKPEEKKEARKSATTSASTSVVASGDGTATVTIDVNGKKETRTFKLGDGNNSFSFSTGDGATVGGTAVAGGGGGAKFGPMKKEKGPWIGIAMEPVQDVVRAQLSLAPGEGIVVSHVAPESPAAKAGLQENDILLRFEDQILLEPSQLRKLIAMKKPGDSVKLAYLRKGERKEATVTLVEHEIEPWEGNPVPWLKGMPGIQLLPGAGMDNRLERFQDEIKKLKEKHPGVIVDKRQWFSGAPGDMLKEQIERLQRGLEDSKLPKEEIEKFRKELDKAKRQAEEAMEHARRTVEEASKAFNESRKPFEKEKKGEQPKKPGEPL